MNPLSQKESLEPIPFGYTLDMGGAERALRCLSIVVSCLSIIGLSLFVFSGFQKYCKETWEGKKWGPIKDAPADVQSTAETTDQFAQATPPIKNTSQTLTPTPTLPPLTTPLEKESSPASLPVFNTPTSPQEETSPDKKIASAPTPTLHPLTTPEEEEVSPVFHIEKIEPFLDKPLEKESSPASLPVFNTPTSPQEETSPDKKIASAPTPTLYPLTTPDEEEVSPVSIPIQPTPSPPTEDSFIEEASISSLSPIQQELIPVQPSKEILKQAFTEVSQQIKNCQKGLMIVDVTPVNTLLQSDQTEEIKEVISAWAKVVKKGLEAEYALIEEATVSTKDIRNICLLKNRILLLKKDLEKILSIPDRNIFSIDFEHLYKSILTFEKPLVLEDETVRKRLEAFLKFSKKNDPKEVHLAIAPLVSLLPESDDVREQAEKFITEFEKTFQKDFFALEQVQHDLHNLSMQLLQASDPLDQLQLMQDTLYRIERFQELSKKLSCFNILLQSPSVSPKALSDSFIKSYQKVYNQAFLDFNLCCYHNLPVDSRDFQRVIKIITMLDQLKIVTSKIDHFSQDLYAFGAKHELATNEKGTAYLRDQLKAIDIDTEKYTLAARPIVPVNISFFPSQTTFNALSRFWIQQDTPEYEREIKKWLESCQEYSHCLTEKEKEQILSEQEIFSQSNPQDQQISALSQKILREFSAKRKLQEEIQDCQLKQKQIRSGRWILPYSQEEQEQISILAEKERLLKQWTKYLQSLNQQIHRLRSSNSAHNTHYLPTQGNDALYTYGSEDDSVELVIAQEKRESDPKLLITPISLSSIDELSEDAIFTVLSENIQAIEKQPTEEQRTSVLSALAILQSSAEHLQKENIKFSTIYNDISQTASLSKTLANKDPLTATNIFTDAIQNLKPGKPLTFFGAWNRDTTPEPICYQIKLTEEGLYHFSVEQENNPTLTLFLDLPKERITSFSLIAYLQGNTVDVSGRNVALAPLKALEQILGNPEVLSTQTGAKVQLPLERVLHLVCSSSDKSEQKEFLARTYYNFGNSALEKLSTSDTNSAQNISYRYRVLRMFIVALQYTQKDSPLTPLIQENIEKFIHYSTDVKKVPSIPLQSEPITSFFTNISYQDHKLYCNEDSDLFLKVNGLIHKSYLFSKALSASPLPQKAELQRKAFVDDQKTTGSAADIEKYFFAFPDQRSDPEDLCRLLMYVSTHLNQPKCKSHLLSLAQLMSESTTRIEKLHGQLLLVAFKEQDFSCFDSFIHSQDPEDVLLGHYFRTLTYHTAKPFDSAKELPTDSQEFKDAVDLFCLVLESGSYLRSQDQKAFSCLSNPYTKRNFDCFFKNIVDAQVNFVKVSDPNKKNNCVKIISSLLSYYKTEDDKLPSHPLVEILTKDKKYTIISQTKSRTLIEVGENPNKKTYHITTNANTQCLVHQKINGDWYQGKLIGNDQKIPLFLHNCIVWMNKERHAIIEPTDHANPSIISKYENEKLNFYFINDLEHKIIKTPKEITDIFSHLAQPYSIITTGTDELLHKIYLTEQGLSCSVHKEDPTLLQFDHPLNYTLSLNTPQHSLFPEKNHLLLQKEGKNVILLRNSQQLNGEYILYQETSPGFFTPLDLEKEQAILATIHLAEKWADLGYFEKAIEHLIALKSDFAKLSEEQKKSITDKIHSLLSRSKIDHPHIAEAAAFRIKLKQIFIQEEDVDQEDLILYEKYRQALHSSLR